MKAVCSCGRVLIFDKEVNEWACINCGYMYDEYEFVNKTIQKTIISICIMVVGGALYFCEISETYG